MEIVFHFDSYGVAFLVVAAIVVMALLRSWR